MGEEHIVIVHIIIVVIIFSSLAHETIYTHFTDNCKRYSDVQTLYVYAFVAYVAFHA